MRFTQPSVGMTPVVDGEMRIVIPRHVARALGIGSGERVLFERMGDRVVIAKAKTRNQKLEKMMDWDPERTGRSERAPPREMKRVWKE